MISHQRQELPKDSPSLKPAILAGQPLDVAVQGE